MSSGTNHRAAALVVGATNPPAPRPRWLRRGRFDLVEVLCRYAVAVRWRPWGVIRAAVVTAAGAGVTNERTGAAAIVAAIPLLIAVVVRVRRNSTRLLAEQERRHSGERAVLEERQR